MKHLLRLVSTARLKAPVIVWPQLALTVAVTFIQLLVTKHLLSSSARLKAPVILWPQQPTWATCITLHREWILQGTAHTTSRQLHRPQSSIYIGGCSGLG